MSDDRALRDEMENLGAALGEAQARLTAAGLLDDGLRIVLGLNP